MKRTMLYVFRLPLHKIRAKISGYCLRCSRSVGLTILYIQQLQQPLLVGVDVVQLTGIERCSHNEKLKLWECFSLQDVYRRAILMVILGRCHSRDESPKHGF